MEPFHGDFSQGSKRKFKLHFADWAMALNSECSESVIISIGETQPFSHDGVGPTRTLRAHNTDMTEDPFIDDDAGLPNFVKTGRALRMAWRSIYSLLPVHVLQGSLLASLRKAASKCTGVAVSDMALAAVKNTINRSNMLPFEVQVQTVQCHDSWLASLYYLSIDDFSQ